MTRGRGDWSRRDLFRLFRRRRPGSAGRAAKDEPAPPKRRRAPRPAEPVFGPPAPAEVERERRAARALLGELPPPKERCADPSELWKRKKS